MPALQWESPDVHDLSKVTELGTGSGTRACPPPQLVRVQEGEEHWWILKPSQGFFELAQDVKIVGRE